MNKLILVSFVALSFCAFTAVPVLAVPTLQTYSPQGTADSRGMDEDTWFVTQSSFNLIVVGAFKNNMDTLTNVTLVVSVPKNSMGAVTINGVELSPLYTDKSFLPDPLYDDDGHLVYDGATFNEHYPFKEGVSDFLTYDLGEFFNVEPVNNYTTEGPISYGAGQGEEKTYSVTISGFESVHFDAFGLVDGQDWRINPGSHDTTTTVVPAPGALLLGSIGMSFVGWLRRRRTL